MRLTSEEAQRLRLRSQFATLKDWYHFLLALGDSDSFPYANRKSQIANQKSKGYPAGDALLCDCGPGLVADQLRLFR